MLNVSLNSLASEQLQFRRPVNIHY